MYRDPIWHSTTPFFINRAPHFLRSWITDRESLTKRLIRCCSGKFNVAVFSQSWAPATLSESKKLNIPYKQTVFIREVHLFCDQKALVYAKTIIPIATLRGEMQKLTQLGAQPLGAVLFANKQIRRDIIETTKITADNSIYKNALLYSEHKDSTIWGRRSLFYLADKPLLVNEIFLPDIANAKIK